MRLLTNKHKFNAINLLALGLKYFGYFTVNLLSFFRDLSVDKYKIAETERKVKLKKKNVNIVLILKVLSFMS